MIFLVEEKSHTGIENLALTIIKAKFKSKQRGEIVRQLYYFPYSTLHELNSEALKRYDR